MKTEGETFEGALEGARRAHAELTQRLDQLRQSEARALEELREKKIALERKLESQRAELAACNQRLATLQRGLEARLARRQQTKRALFGAFRAVLAALAIGGWLMMLGTDNGRDLGALFFFASVGVEAAIIWFGCDLADWLELSRG